MFSLLLVALFPAKRDRLRRVLYRLFLWYDVRPHPMTGIQLTRYGHLSLRLCARRLFSLMRLSRRYPRRTCLLGLDRPVRV